MTEIMDANYLPVNPTKYSRLFYFYTSILSEYPALIYVSKLVVVFSYIQSVFVCFVPIFILSNNVNEYKQIKDIVSVFIGFSTRLDQIQYDNYFIYSSTITLMLAFCSLVIAYLAYRVINKTSSLFFKARGILFLFVPNCYFGQFAIIVGQFVRRMISMQDNFMNLIIVFWISLTFGLLLKFSFMISPLLMQNPMFSSAHIPTNIFPNYDFFYHGIADAIFILFSEVFNSGVSIICIYFFYMIYAGYHIYRMYKLPYIPHFESSLSITSDICHILFVPMSVFFANRYLYGYIAIVFVFSVIAFFFVYYLINKKGNKMLDALKSDNLCNMDVDSIMFCIQEALVHNSLNKEILSYIDQELENSTRLDTVAVRLYIRLLVDDADTPDGVIVNEYLRTMNDVGLSTCKKFFLFELLSAYSKYDQGYNFTNIEGIVTMYNNYENTSSLFWENMMKGKINNAFTNLADLNNQFRDIIETYRNFHMFYPTNQFIQQIGTNFIKNIVSDYYSKNYKYEDEVGQIKLKYNQFVDMPSKTVVSIAFETDKSADNFCSNFDETTIKPRIEKYVVKKFSCRTTTAAVIFSLTVIAFLLSSMSFPIIILSKTDSMVEFFEIGKDIIDIFKSWIKITIAIDLGINETESSPIACKNLMKTIGLESICDESETYTGYFNNIVESSQIVLDKMLEFFETNKISGESKYIIDLHEIMVEPVISYFPFRTKINNVTLDPRSLMVYYSTYIIEHVNTTNDVKFEDSKFVNYFRERYLKFSSITQSITEQLKKMNDCLQDYSVNEIENLSVNFNLMTILIASLLAFVILLSLTLYFLSVSIVNEVKEDLKKYFRPRIHPSLAEDIKFVEEIEDVNGSNIVKFSLRTFLFSLFYAIVCIALWVLIENQYSKIWDTSNSILFIHRFSISSSAVFSSCLTAWQMSWMNIPKFQDDAIKTSMSFFKDQIDFIYNSSMDVFKVEGIPVERNKCNSYSGHYLHDYYNCWSIQYLHMLLAFYSREYASKGEYESHQPLFANIQNIVIEHSVPKLDNIILTLENLLQKNFGETSFTISVMILFNTVFLIFGIVYICQALFYFISFKYQMGRIVMDLDPIFIARNPDLVEYIVGYSPKFLDWSKESPIFDILNSSKTPIIVISEQLSITAFTDKVPTLFNYRPEQLVGQHYTMLFKKKGETVTPAQESFFQNVVELLSQNMGTSSKIINGVTSTGDYVRLDVHANVVSYDSNRKCLILELVSLMDNVQLEEATILCQDLIKEIIEKSTPINIFQADSISDEYLTRRFHNSVLVFTAIKKDFPVRGATDFNRSPLPKTLPLLSGEDNALVIANTGTYTLVIFSDLSDQNKQIARGVNFVKEYGKDLPSGTLQYSLMIDIPPFDAAFYLPPDLPKEFDGREMPPEAFSAFAPAMTVNPFVPMLNEIGDMISIMRPNMVIVSDNIALNLDENCQLLPVTLINSKRQMFATKLFDLKLI